MLSLDGSVLAPEELVRRVEQLLVEAGVGSETEPFAPARRVGRNDRDLERKAQALAICTGRIAPPELNQGSGLRARAVRAVKRTIRKLIVWYVEPRLASQGDYDALNLELLHAMLDSYRMLASEVEQLAAGHASLSLELEAARHRHGQLEHELDAFGDRTKTALDRIVLGRAIETVTLTSADTATPLARRGEPQDVPGERHLERCLAKLVAPAVRGTIVDLGCQTGDLVALAIAAGHEAIGFELDPVSVQRCQERGIPARLGDPLRLLAELPHGSLRAVHSARLSRELHLFELQQLLELAVTRLAESGVLVLDLVAMPLPGASGEGADRASHRHDPTALGEAIAALARNAGFAQVELERRPPPPVTRWQDNLPDSEIGEAVRALLHAVFIGRDGDAILVATR